MGESQLGSNLISGPRPQVLQTYLQCQEGANAIQISQATTSQPQHLQVAQRSAQVSAEGRQSGVMVNLQCQLDWL